MLCQADDCSEFQNCITMKKLLLGWAFCVLVLSASAQQVVKGLTAANGQYIGFLEYKPTDYGIDPSIKYPLIVFMHGIGERGNGTSQIWSVAANGIPKYINAGHPMRFFWNGKWETFLVLSPQLSSSYGDWVDFYTEEMIKYAKANLQIDTNRIIVTGLSLGGGGAWKYSTSSLAHAKEIAAVATVCGTCSAVTPANIAIANLPLWAFHASNDGTVGPGCTYSQVASVEAANPAIAPLMTIYSSGGHGIWDRAYDTAYNWQNPNIFEWFLGQNKSLPVNKLPVSNAGPNITISNSPGTVNLSGINSTDTDGSILRYIWRKVSGPSAGTIVTPISTNGFTTITNLSLAGTYVFELKVVDDRASTAVSTVTVTVTSGTVSNIPPVTKAGNDLMTATSTAQLNGASSYDPDGNITSYQWSKVAGPGTYALSSTSIASPELSFLLLGDYAFELQATDNAGATTRDTVYIHSTASILPVEWTYFNVHRVTAGRKLIWATQAEFKNDRYELQRSSDGVHYQHIGEVKASGTAIGNRQYEFTDATDQSGKLFYRIRQISFDGSSSYSGVVSINELARLAGSLELYPNPAAKFVRVSISRPETGKTAVTVYSVDGRKLINTSLMKEAETISTTLNLDHLAKGTYLLKISIGDTVQEFRKLVKQ